MKIILYFANVVFLLNSILFIFTCISFCISVMTAVYQSLEEIQNYKISKIFLFSFLICSFLLIIIPDQDFIYQKAGCVINKNYDYYQCGKEVYVRQD